MSTPTSPSLDGLGEGLEGLGEGDGKLPEGLGELPDRGEGEVDKPGEGEEPDPAEGLGLVEFPPGEVDGEPGVLPGVVDPPGKRSPLPD